MRLSSVETEKEIQGSGFGMNTICSGESEEEGGGESKK